MKLFSKISFVALLILGLSGEALPAGELSNQMASQASPYLRLHADDLVAWQPWQQDSLQAAEKSGKPIFLSIGYLACHWCHVMRKESFSDPEIAGLINQSYYPILVDREELPQVDALYQSALAVMNLANGWPLTVFLTNDRKPIWGGAYFPKKAKSGAPGLDAILAQVADVYAKRKSDILADAKQVIEQLEEESKSAKGSIALHHIDKFAKIILSEIDPFEDGFEGAPKFPNIIALESLWRAYIRTGRKDYGDAVENAVHSMIRGGLYDHIGGGFFRYTVDRQWRIPHFEKMLGTNARLLRLMVEVWREKPDKVLQARIYQTVEFLFREMLLPGQGFISSLDADSETEEGKEEEGAYYVWSSNQLKKRLAGRYALFSAAYDLAPREGEALDTEDDPGILFQTKTSLGDLAKQFKIPPSVVTAQRDAAKNQLAKIRSKRERPRQDQKILAADNGSVISALIEAGRALDREDWLSKARMAFEAIFQSHFDASKQLHRSVVQGRLGPPATLSDYAHLAQAALHLYEVSGELAFLNQAKHIAGQAIELMWDGKNHGFFSGSSHNTRFLLIRSKPILDSDAASANSLMLSVLARLYYLTGEDKWYEIGDQTLTAFGGIPKSFLFGHAGFLNAAEDWLAALQIVVIGDEKAAALKPLRLLIDQTSLPTRTFQIIAPGTRLPDTHPAQFKEQLDGKPTVYVCRGQICSLPATTRQELAQTLISFRRGR
ncbi:MAG: thioredoxin domain-containing protein [Rhodospirillaceae bacterium]|jgi:uncharacterized protein|nr:thioredoxin domain-containing protein [Rhodospirillaceae bacterium]